MLVLANTTDTLEVVLFEAHATGPLKIEAFWRDTSTTTFDPSRSLADTNGTTDVTAVAAPAASTQRLIQTVNIYNNDTKLHQVQVHYDASGTEYTLFKGSIPVGGSACYTSETGWRIMAPGASTPAEAEMGTPEITTGTVGTDWTMQVMKEDAPINNTTTANTLMPLPALAIPLKGGQRYQFRFLFFYTSPALSTGARFAFLNVPASTELRFRVATCNALASRALYEGLSAFNSPTIASTNSASITAAQTSMIEGYIFAQKDGLLVPAYASEITLSGITPKAGSYVEYIAV